MAQLIVSIGFTLVEITEIQLLFYYSRSKREETQAYSFMFAVFTAFTGVGTLLAGYLPKWIDSSGIGYQNTLLVTSSGFCSISLCAGGITAKGTKTNQGTAPAEWENLQFLPYKRTFTWSASKIIIIFNYGVFNRRCSIQSAAIFESICKVSL